MAIENFEDLRRFVDKGKGVRLVLMSLLRDCVQSERLGKHVCTTISEHLATYGLAHFPAELPRDQNAYVRVYDPESELGAAVDACYTLTPAANKVIRASFAGTAAKKLQAIRDLVV